MGGARFPFLDEMAAIYSPDRKRAQPAGQMEQRISVFRQGGPAGHYHPHTDAAANGVTSEQQLPLFIIESYRTRGMARNLQYPHCVPTAQVDHAVLRNGGKVLPLAAAPLKVRGKTVVPLIQLFRVPRVHIDRAVTEKAGVQKMIHMGMGDSQLDGFVGQLFQHGPEIPFSHPGVDQQGFFRALQQIKGGILIILTVEKAGFSLLGQIAVFLTHSVFPLLKRDPSGQKAE